MEVNIINILQAPLNCFVLIGQKAGISIGAIFGFVLIGVVVALVTFFGYRLAIIMLNRTTV